MTHSYLKFPFVATALCGALAAGLSLSAAAQKTQDPATAYANTVADAAITARYNTHLEQQLSAQQDEIASLQKQLDGLDQVSGEVEPMLQRMFDQLQQFVAADIPFLREERTKRIETLRELLGDVSKSPAEKYRRLLEAYGIELEYGRNMDSYRDTLADGREADFVRLGRVSLMYRTTDGQESGYWNKEQKSWVADPRYSRAIELALRIAKQETAPDLLAVPVPAASQGGKS